MATQKVYNATTKQYVDIDVTITPDEDATLADRKKDFRLERNIRLRDCDWALASDSPLTDEQKTEATTYRQALRDLPADANFPNNVFPTKPDFL
jgi:hypothetical protein|tara:strand:- start:31 stop:312 length:282 start_codon:yes stop_codon:yes gene_type:complete